MAIEVQFVYPTAEHCQVLAEGMRGQDLAELAALGHDTPEKVRRAVDESVATSVLTATIMLNGKLACIFGVAPINVLGGVGAVWLLATDHGQSRATALTRWARPYIAEMLVSFPSLVNMVHVDNTASRRWLMKLGATFGEPVIVPSGAMFIPFEIKAGHV